MYHQQPQFVCKLCLNWYFCHSYGQLRGHLRAVHRITQLNPDELRLYMVENNRFRPQRQQNHVNRRHTPSRPNPFRVSKQATVHASKSVGNGENVNQLMEAIQKNIEDTFEKQLAEKLASLDNGIKNVVKEVMKSEVPKLVETKLLSIVDEAVADGARRLSEVKIDEKASVDAELEVVLVEDSLIVLDESVKNQPIDPLAVTAQKEQNQNSTNGEMVDNTATKSSDKSTQVNTERIDRNAQQIVGKVDQSLSDALPHVGENETNVSDDSPTNSDQELLQMPMVGGEKFKLFVSADKN